MSGPVPFFNARAVSLMVSLLAAVAFCFYAPRAQSQDSRQKNQDDVISLKAHLVNIDVMVKDKKGKYITDLKAEDFTVVENGAQQKIEFFDPPLAASPLAASPLAGNGSESGKTNSSSLSTSGGLRNIISLVLDGQTTELTNLKQVREGTLKYVRERITDTDTVAVFGVSNGLQLIQTFTQDKAKLIQAIESTYTLTASNRNLERNQVSQDIERLREELKGAGDLSQPQSAAQGSAAARAMIASRALEQFVKLRAQLSLQQARPILAAIAAICEAQRAIPGKKTLVLFSQGFVASSVLDWQVQGTIDMANRANVAVYIIDSAGLTAGGPQSGALVPSGPLGGVAATGSPASRSLAVGGESVFDNVRYEGLNREQDILYRISGDTGGEFFKGNNDIGKGLERIDQEIRSRYTLAYYSTDPNFDGSFRKLKIDVRRPDVHVLSRSGYYAIGNEEIVPLSPEDRKLLANVAEAASNPALPLFMELVPFRAQAGRYVVPMSIEMPPSAVKFDRKGDRQEMHLDVVGVIRESQDHILSRLGGSFNVGLSAEQYQSIVNNNIFYRQDMELAPGTYDVDLIVRDKLSGKMAAKRVKLVLPVADAEFSTTAVTLSRQATPVGKTAQSSDVFSHGGVQIRPSPGREFRVTDNLIIFFELYNAATSPETSKPLVRVTVTLVKDNKAATKPIDYVLTDTVAEPVLHQTFAKYLKLTGLATGKYTAVIEVKDMVARKLVTQQASFVIVE
ncbi:MAG: VWA domain-containing protein [Blastocatellia bacterium]